MTITFWMKAHSFMVLLTGSTCAVISLHNFSLTESIFFKQEKPVIKLIKTEKGLTCIFYCIITSKRYPTAVSAVNSSLSLASIKDYIIKQKEARAGHKSYD